MKGIFNRIAYAMLSIVFAAPVTAAPQWCQGTVANLWVYSNGNVFVQPSYRGDYTMICNMNTEIGGISVTTCATWFAILRSAVQRQSNIMVHYPDAPACNALPTYGGSILPGYVMQVN